MSAEAVAWGEESSDAELITAARGGDSHAFGALYERHSGAARTVARQYTRSSADADDVVSDAFARVYSIVRGGGGPDVAFRAYLFTVVRRLAHSRVEAGRRVHPTDDLATFESAFGSVEGVDDPALAGFERGVVARAYGSLPERWQAVLWYTEIERLQPAQVAPLLGLTANGVAALAYRAREGLREAYLQQHLVAAPSDGCRTVNGKLGAYVRGGLAKRETAHVRAHLETCEACRGLVLELGDVNHGLRGIIAPLVLGVAGLGALASPLPVGLLGAAGGAAAGGAGSGGAAAAGGSAAAGAGGAGSATTAAGSGAAGASTAAAGGGAPVLTGGAAAGSTVAGGAATGTTAGAVGAGSVAGTAGAVTTGAATTGVVTTGAATGAATGAMTGAVTGAATTGVVTTGVATTGAVTTGAVTTGAVTTGVVTTGAVTGTGATVAGGTVAGATAAGAAGAAAGTTAGAVASVAGVTGATAGATAAGATALGAATAAGMAGAATATGATAMAGAGAASGTALGLGGLIAALPGGVAGAVTAGVVGVSLAVGSVFVDPATTRPTSGSNVSQGPTSTDGGPGAVAGGVPAPGGPAASDGGSAPLFGTTPLVLPPGAEQPTTPSTPGTPAAGPASGAPDPATGTPSPAPADPGPGTADPVPATAVTLALGDAGAPVVLVPGDLSRVAVTLVNTGETDATSLRAALVLPPGVDLVDGTAGGDGWQPCAGGGTDLCLGSLPGGTSSQISASVRVGAEVPVGATTIGVAVGATGFATRTLSVPAQVRAAPADLEIGGAAGVTLTAGEAFPAVVLGRQPRPGARPRHRGVGDPAGRRAVDRRRVRCRRLVVRTGRQQRLVPAARHGCGDGRADRDRRGRCRPRRVRPDRGDRGERGRVRHPDARRDSRRGRRAAPGR